ncbi:MAG: DUF6597 domain-containing transcriptional factor [Saprospiraceae bacterium]
MSYHEIPASKNLSHIIDTYWFFSQVAAPTTHRIFPDACADLIINLGDKTNKIPASEIALSGIMTQFSDTHFPSNTKLLGIRFKAGQLGQLTQIPMQETKNKTLLASDIFPTFSTNFLEQIATKKKLSTQLDFLEHKLSRLIHSTQQEQDLPVLAVVNTLQTSTNLSLQLVAKRHCISLRQLERRFKNKVGISMKSFQRVSRFKKVFKVIQSQPQKSISEIAYQNGYYDHAHLAKECYTFTGKYPSQLRSIKN